MPEPCVPCKDSPDNFKTTRWYAGRGTFSLSGMGAVAVMEWLGGPPEFIAANSAGILAENRALRPEIGVRPGATFLHYSAAPEEAAEPSPTLRRTNRRMEMFSPSLAIIWATSSPTVTDSS